MRVGIHRRPRFQRESRYACTRNSKPYFTSFPKTWLLAALLLTWRPLPFLSADLPSPEAILYVSYIGGCLAGRKEVIGSTWDLDHTMDRRVRRWARSYPMVFLV